jgi:hypothetical protein
MPKDLGDGGEQTQVLIFAELSGNAELDGDKTSPHAGRVFVAYGSSINLCKRNLPCIATPNIQTPSECRLIAKAEEDETFLGVEEASRAEG